MSAFGCTLKLHFVSYRIVVFERRLCKRVCDTAACAVLGLLYYFIFYSRVQCTSSTAGGRAGRRLLEPAASGGVSAAHAHDTGGPSGASTHIFMFKKS